MNDTAEVPSIDKSMTAPPMMARALAVICDDALVEAAMDWRGEVKFSACRPTCKHSNATGGKRMYNKMTKPVSLITAALASTVGAALAVPIEPAFAVAPRCTAAIDFLPDGPGGGVWVPGTPAANFNCSLVRGDGNRAVWALQRTLRFCYGKSISVDSQFGPRTETALTQVQDAVGPRRDGIYGPETAGKIVFSSIDFDDGRFCAGI